VTALLVLSTSKVWVTRKQVEPKVRKLMSALENMETRLVPVRKATVG
jgi:hypothetical protein